ncbi:MAG: hypothetical protein ACRERU_08270 [Methylococcales bacterium]
MSPRIGTLISHFDDLSRAHEAVLKAKRQVELLSPMVADCERHSGLATEIADLRKCRENLCAHFAGLKLALLDTRLAHLNEEWSRLDVQVKRLDDRHEERRGAVDEIKRAIAENGGDRLERLAADIKRKEQERDRRKQRSDRYRELILTVDEAPADDAAGFLAQRSSMSDLTEVIEE